MRIISIALLQSEDRFRLTPAPGIFRQSCSRRKKWLVASRAAQSGQQSVRQQSCTAVVDQTEDWGVSPLSRGRTEALPQRMLSYNPLYSPSICSWGIRLQLFLCLNKFDNRMGVLMGAFRLNLDPTLSFSIPFSSESHLCTPQQPESE